jgi:hypothetical protein
LRTFDTEEEAVAGARELILTQPDSDPEIWDIATGKPAAPAASKAGSRPQGRLLTLSVRRDRHAGYGHGCGWLGWSGE